MIGYSSFTYYIIRHQHTTSIFHTTYLYSYLFTYQSNIQDYTVDQILYSIGRTPVLPTGLKEYLGPKGVDKDGVIVDEGLRAYKHEIYCAGDVISGNLQFTHLAGKQGFSAVRNALFPGTGKAQPLCNTPRVTFTYPELASVGLSTVQQARDKGIQAEAHIKRGSDRSVCDDAEKYTMMELIVDSKHGTVLGCNVVGPRAGELINEYSLALHKKLTLADLSHAMHAYPSYGFEVQVQASSVYMDQWLDTFKARMLKKFYIH